MTRLAVRSVFLSAALLGTLAAGHAVAAPPDPRAGITGRVSDAETGAPIEGAVVIATWWVDRLPNPAHLMLGLLIGAGHGGAQRRTAYVSEVLTGPDGRFSIPSWTDGDQWNGGRLVSDSPTIWFLAPGYAPGQDAALYRPGRAPEREHRVIDPSVQQPTPIERDKALWRNALYSLDSAVREADPESTEASRLRERARRAQQQARAVIELELNRAGQ